MSWVEATVCFVIKACLVVLSHKILSTTAEALIIQSLHTHSNAACWFDLISLPEECTEGERKLRVDPKE